MPHESGHAPLSQTETGFEVVRSVTKRLRVAPAAVGAGNALTLWTPATGKKVEVRSVHVTVNAATVVQVQTYQVFPGVAQILADIEFAGAGAHSIYFGSPGWPAVNVDDIVRLVTTNAVNMGGTVTGTER